MFYSLVTQRGSWRLDSHSLAFLLKSLGCVEVGSEFETEQVATSELLTLVKGIKPSDFGFNPDTKALIEHSFDGVGIGEIIALVPLVLESGSDDSVFWLEYLRQRNAGACIKDAQKSAYEMHSTVISF